MYEYKAKVVKIVDGDTIDCDVELGFHMTARIRFRLARINTPEVRGKEREQGLISKAYVVNKLEYATAVRVQTGKTGKYGRWIAEILYTEELSSELLKSDKAVYKNLNDELVEKNLAEYVSY